jgi:hypothetical protein
MRFKPTLIKFALVTLCVAVHSSQSIASPTDTELKAAYCTAVKKHAVDVLTQSVSGIESLHADSGPARKALADTDDQLSRLRAYVVPKMLNDDTGALAAAFARGQHDSARLDDPQLAQCGSKCFADATTNPAKLNACVASCAPELFPRVWSCNDLSWLPF